MIVKYIDTSVVLAWVLQEPDRPEDTFWLRPPFVSSVLTEYETWVRLHAYRRASSHGADADNTLGSLVLLPLTREIGARSRAAFPTRVRTLDALHLATAESVRNQGYTVEIATYDLRMREAAVAMGFPLALAEPRGRVPTR